MTKLPEGKTRLDLVRQQSQSGGLAGLKKRGRLVVSIDRLEEDRTVICVAHRLSTLASMDWIVVLFAGRIIEEGTYRQLLSADGPFAHMARQQGISLAPPEIIEFAESAV